MYSRSISNVQDALLDCSPSLLAVADEVIG